MKKIWIIVMVLVVLIPSMVNALELVGEEVKYYKTYEYGNVNSLQSLAYDNILSVSEEISEEEYNGDTEDLIRGSVVIHTNYKRLTTRLFANGLYYRYEASLLWKKYPAKRSYDIIAIGFFASVTPTGTIAFTQEACDLYGSCSYYNTNYPQIFSSGLGTSFKLPSTTGLSLLEQTLSFNVTKTNPNSTVVNQRATGDYAHATSNVTLATSKKYTVDYSVGINLDSSITNYYDTTPCAMVTWSGTW